MPPEQKVKFLKAAWDAVGSEFGSRHTQYEMFYAGARFVTCGHSFRTFDWKSAGGLVDSLLLLRSAERIGARSSMIRKSGRRSSEKIMRR